MASKCSTIPSRGRAHRARERKHITAEKALYSIGRTGATRSSGSSARVSAQTIVAGLMVNATIRLPWSTSTRSATSSVFPAWRLLPWNKAALRPATPLASPPPRVRTCSLTAFTPFPKCRWSGKNEQELTEEEVPYEIGKASYREIARGQIVGDTTGMLKIMFHPENRRLLGVHIIGEGASELVHIGQVVLTYGGTIDYFINTVFNYPTLAECYKTAAFDGVNRLGDATGTANAGAAIPSAASRSKPPSDPC